MRTRWSVLPLVMVMLSTSVLFADTLQLTNGKKVDGQIVRQDKDSILIDTGVGTPITYYRDEIASVISAPFADPSSDADKLENEAVELIDAGKRAEGLQKMLKAISTDPTPLRRMNYGSVLFGDGVEKYKKGDREGALVIFQSCERQLQVAIAAFNQSTDTAYLSQCYYLLGEMYLNAFGSKEKASEYYTKSLSYFDHPAAKAALAKITVN